MQITVTRDAADQQGPDIIDDLLVTDPVGISRGRREIDYSYPAGRELVACQCPKHGYIETGSLASVIEAQNRYAGIVRYWSLTLTIDENGTRYTADTRMTIERIV